MTIYEKHAKRFADAVNAMRDGLVGGKAKFWDAATCKAKGYKAKAGVVLEETGYGAFSDTTVLLDSGYGREIAVPGMTINKAIFAEPYASWLLLFYEA